VAALALVAMITLAGCTSSGSKSAPGAPSSESGVPPKVMLGIAAAEKACMNLGDALTKQRNGAPAADVATAMTAAAAASRAAAEQDLRWSGFANDIGAIANGEATQAGTTRVGGVCAHLSQDASIYTSTAPYPAG
jgi:hypothetical protein